MNKRLQRSFSGIDRNACFAGIETLASMKNLFDSLHTYILGVLKPVKTLGLFEAERSLPATRKKRGKSVCTSIVNS